VSMARDKLWAVGVEPGSGISAEEAGLVRHAVYCLA
jgi:hypothetical protein